MSILHLDFNEMFGENTRWKPLGCCMLEAADTKQQLHSHLPSISPTIQLKQTRYSWLNWRSYDIFHVYMNAPEIADQQNLQKLYQLCVNTGCFLEDLPRVMADWDKWQARITLIHENQFLIRQ